MLNNKGVLLSVLTFLLLPASTVLSADAAEFLLFYANDVRGELEPCG